jgi:hypothetical protein
MRSFDDDGEIGPWPKLPAMSKSGTSRGLYEAAPGRGAGSASGMPTMWAAIHDLGKTDWGNEH